MITSELTAIESKVSIRAPRSRVWRALTTSQEFARWFGAEVPESFTPGRRVDMTSTHPCGENSKSFYIQIERMEPEHTFSWRWHPSSANHSEDGATLVEFQLEESGDGTVVTVKESGFDRISLERRAKAFSQNSRGWEMQLQSLQRYASEEA